MRYATTTVLTLALLGSALGPASAARTRSAYEGRAKGLISEGQESLRQGQFAGAIKTFERATQADGGSAAAFFHLGNAFFQRGFQKGTPEAADPDDAQKAVEAYQTAMALDPELKSLDQPYLLYHGLAQCYTAQGKYEDAVASLRKAARASPKNPMPPLYAAEVRLRMRDTKTAAENLHVSVQRARRINGYKSLSKLIRAHPQFMSLAALPQGKNILDTYDQVESGSLPEARAKEQVEERLSMRDSLRDSVTSQADSSRLRILEAPKVDDRVLDYQTRGDAEMRAARWGAALALYNGALKADEGKGTLGAVQRAAVYEGMGTAYRKLGLTGEAVRTLQKAAQEMPTRASVYYELALAESLAGQFTSALHALDLALKHSRDVRELRRTLLLAKTDMELDPLRDLPAYQTIVRSHSARTRSLD